jgi:hypothetical protein
LLSSMRGDKESIVGDESDTRIIQNSQFATADWHGSGSSLLTCKLLGPGFDRRAVHVEYAVDNVPPGLKCFITLPFSPHVILPHSSTLTATGVRATCSGRRNQPGAIDFSLPQNNHIGSEAHPDSY